MLIFLIILSFFAGCKSEEKFPDLGDKLANPIDVAADSSGNYFYVLNSDFPRDYNAGSIITLDKEGNKVNVIQTKRLGRSLTVAGNDLIATYSTEENSPSRVELYDITSPKTPKLVTSWTPANCNPINAVMKGSYKYFAVACSNGGIHIGELKSPREESQLHYVRRYPGPRRAMYLDTKRNQLIAFPTDLGKQDVPDLQLVDENSFTDDLAGTKTAVSNDIPDAWEEQKNFRRNKARRGMYQYVVYDIATEAAKESPFPTVEDLEELQPELRWTYFSLNNFDGSPDIPMTTTNINTKYYRTNFWQAKPDPNDDDVFYLSHRGSSDSDRTGSQHANSIVKVRITGDLKAVNKVAPKTSEVLSFERVYGFKGEGADEATRHFPGHFEIANINGSPLLMVNHFRDPVHFSTSPYSALASKVIGDNSWYSEIIEKNTGHSYFQFTMTSTGRVLAVSFYQNILILLDTAPGTAITEIKTIN
jgi:DNA-binding beta-propeller fold protein YncE